MYYLQGLVFAIIVGASLALSGEFVPKSFYTIDRHGHKSDVVYLRQKRSADGYYIPRLQRSASSSGASASASSSSSSDTGSGGSAYNSGYSGIAAGPANVPFGAAYNPAYNPAFNQFGQSGGAYPGSFQQGYSDPSYNRPTITGQTQSFASSSVSTSSNSGGLGGGLHSRFGGDDDSGSSGIRGVFTASSSSIDSDGKVRHTVQSGKF